MKSKSQLEKEGYTIDTFAAGRPMAYKGERFKPTGPMQKCLTDEEEKMVAIIKELQVQLESSHEYGVKWVDDYQPEEVADLLQRTQVLLGEIEA